MEQRNKSTYQIPILMIKLAFWSLLFFWFIVCVFLLLNSQEDFRLTDHDSRSFDEGWVLSEDGVTPITVPGRIPEGVTEARIQNTLPEDITDRTTVMVKGQHQNIVVRIDGEVVGVLENQETRLFSSHMFSAYLMIPLTQEDAGKIIEIQYYAPEPETEGKVNDIQIGSEKGLLLWLLDSYAIDVIFAILLFNTGVVIMTFGLIIRFRFRENPNTDITYLGVTAICTAIWIIGESRMRQVYYGQLSVGELILWSALFLAPIPMLFYVNSLQNQRHSKLYMVGSGVAVITEIVMAVLVLTNTYDFYDMYRVGWIIILGSGLMILCTTIWDYAKGFRHWKLLVGILLLLVCVALQMWTFVYSPTGSMSNIYISIGLLLFMDIMGLSDISDLLKQRQQQFLAIKANETKTDFLANMSHEIRTPINAMLGFDEMILREEGNEQIIEYAFNIKKAGENLLSLINDILDFSKVEAGKMEIINDDYETERMLTDVINIIAMKTQDKGLTFETYIGRNIPRILYGDEMRVKQILTNVLNNAVKYTETGSVTLSVNFDKMGSNVGRLRFSIEDTGVGIRPEDISRITEAFQRFDVQKNRSIEGVGLGMSIVADLLQQMGGQLRVYSTYGKGSDFRILIPQVIQDETPINYVHKSRQGHTHVIPAYQALFLAPEAQVLFVDDNAMNLSVVQELLKRTKIQIDTAESGAKCLELTRQKQYHLIFMDHLMPEMDGIETMQRLRREEGNPNQQTPVIALTANAIKGVREFYLEKGFDEYMTKPIEGERLEKLLIELLPSEYVTVIKPQETKEMETMGPLRVHEKSEAASKAEAYMQELTDLLEQAHISLEKGYHFAGRSMGRFHWMLKLFADNFSEKYRRLSSAYEEERVEDYMIEVHSLKTNAKGVGANTLSNMALEHEENSRKHDWNYVQLHWKELLEEWLRVVNGIQNYLGNDEAVEIPDHTAETKEADDVLTPEQRMMLDNCLAFIEQYEADPAVALLENLMKEDITDETKDILTQALEHLGEFDYLGAEEVLKHL